MSNEPKARPIGQKVQSQSPKISQKKQASDCRELEKKLAQYQQDLKLAKERELKALADYNNLVKRHSDHQSKMVEMASLDLIEKLLSPLHHLSLAADHLNDEGVNMVLNEFWQVLEAEGLQEINPEGEEFDENRMEAVDRVGEGTKVKQVLQRGFELKGQVIKPAKVVVG